MSIGALNVGNSKVLTASGAITPATTSGALLGYLVTASTALTLKAWDSLTATGTVLHDTTPAVAVTNGPVWIPCNMAYQTGLFITIGGSGSVAVVFI